MFVPNVELNEWIQRGRQLIVERRAGSGEWKYPMKEIETLSEWSINGDGVRAFARILNAKASTFNAKTDRQLAKRSDALGALYVRAPKRAAKRAA
jgi:hypothetical protein